VVGHHFFALESGYGEKAFAQESEVRFALGIEFQHVGADRNIFRQFVSGALQLLAGIAQLFLRLALLRQLPEEHGEELADERDADEKDVQVEQAGVFSEVKRTLTVAGGVEKSHGDEGAGNADGRKAEKKGEGNEQGLEKDERSADPASAQDEERDDQDRDGHQSRKDNLLGP